MEGFSFSEIIVIIIIAIIIYGKDLPQAARKMATIYSKFRRQLADVREEIRRQIPMDEIENSLKVDLPTGPGGEPPSAPSLLTASPSESNVLLTWNSAVGASSYTIRRSTGPQDPWLIVAMSIPELAWTDTDVQSGKTYHYVVSAVNGTGESGNSDEAVAVIPGGPAPAQAPAPAASMSEAPAPSAAAPAPAPEAAVPANGTTTTPPGNHAAGETPPLPSQPATEAKAS
jgi:Sec-independent protein translocase protein TatA